MAQLRNFQFLRNTTISSFASYAAARTAAVEAFAGINTLQDGELVLFSYKLGEATTVHTLLGIKRNGGIEILGNYDELTAEYQSYVASEIAKLDTPEGGVTGSNNGVSVTVKQVDGKIDSVSVVAPSLTDAIAELDVPAFSLTELNGTTLQGYQISEVDGEIVKGTTPETLLTFASAPTAENKVVTQAEITALNADKTSTNGKNVQVQVIEEAGKITGVNVTTDNTVNANDVATAITTAIEGLDSTKSNIETLANSATTTDIRVEVVETDGKLTAVNVTDTLAAVAHSGEAADVTIADTDNLFTASDVEKALAEVMTKANTLEAAQLSAGNGISITDKKINSDFVVSIETRAEGEFIVIKGAGENGTEITSVNANAFVKDGFLQSVVLDEKNGELVFTWNTDAEAGEENQVTKIAISELCDVYTAKENDWVVLNGFEFSHKTVEGLDSTNAHGITDDVTVDSTDEKTFKVPTLTVDAAGHVTSVDEKTVTITLPESIDTALQGVTATGDDYITATFGAKDAENKQALTVSAKIGDYAAEGQVDGLATTSATKTYVDDQIDELNDKIEALDDSITTVTKGTGISVTDAGTGNDHAYTVALAEAKATVTENTDDYVAAEGTHTRISDITVDDYGRVTAVTKTTVTENFDAGTY